MRQLVLLLICSGFLFLSSCNRSAEPGKPLSVHPQNPHYFLFREKPAILIGSTEHYGAVVNLDFDYIKYLDELAASGLNVTRTFSGAYVEPSGAFGIRKNTLAPEYGRFISPWSRSTIDGYANGGNKFDLSEWDEAYFSRLKDFVEEAGKRGIIVELDLFSNYYDTIQWQLSPLYFNNNINGFGNLEDHKEVLSLKHPEILDLQEKMVRKIINELKDYDNLYYEICNEPYFGDTTALKQWEAYMTDIVVDEEKDRPGKHLISNNIANNYRFVEKPRKGVSIYNFHYARPPVTIPMNFHLNMPLGDNETGFDGIAGTTYRKEAWNFILAGGALFNHLDYSFTTDNEDGSYVVTEGQPGGGSKELRNQFRILAEFMKSVSYVNMKPVGKEMLRYDDQENTNIQGLADGGNEIALYISRKDTLHASSVFDINLPAGSYKLTWTDTKTGENPTSEVSVSAAGWIPVTTPQFTDDVALTIIRKP
jgi:hypothetical protein